MVMAPPLGMASRALTARFSTAISSWLRSTSTVPIAGGKRTTMLMFAPSERSSRSVMPLTRSGMATATGLRFCRRAKASMRWVRMAPRWAACTALATSGAILGSSPMRRCTSSRLPSTAVSRLLKSCATPPVSWPIASIFCDWKSASRASRDAAGPPAAR